MSTKPHGYLILFLIPLIFWFNFTDEKRKEQGPKG